MAVAQDGREALRVARERRPDLLVLDVMLPEVDGLAVCRTLREESDVPVILLTGWGQRLMDDGETPAHVDRVLNKPPKLTELRAALASLIEKAQT